MSRLAKFLGALLSLFSALAPVDLFPAPNRAHWLGLGCILAYTLAAFCDELDNPRRTHQQSEGLGK